MMGLDAMILVFWMLSLSQLFHFPLSPSSRDSLVPLSFLSFWWYHLHIWGYWYFCRQCWFQLVLHPAQRFSWCTLHQFSSVHFSRWVVSDSLWPHESQHTRPLCSSPSPGVHSDSCPSSPWYHPAISSSSSPSPPAPNPSQHQSLFQWVNSSHEVAKVLEFQL